MTDPTAHSRAVPPDHASRMAAALPAVGERLGVWRVTAPLFEVGSGHWFRVEHALAAGEAGLALVYRSEADAQAVLMRFAEDSDALARLTVPGWGAPMDCGLSPSGSPYLVVPAMEGAPLMRVAMALPLRRRMELLLELVTLLDAAQAHGLVLHELDPGMLWLSPSQQLCWLGQGLAPRGSEAPATLVRAAEPLADPRQRQGARPDARSEAHALGRLLGLLINGRLPRKDGLPDGRVDSVAIEAAATPVASLQSWLSLSAAHRESLDRLLDRAMTDGHTFPDRAALARAVSDWLADTASPHPGGMSRIVVPLPGSGARPSSSMPLAPEPPPALKPPGTSWAERIAGLAAVLAVAVLLVWLLMRTH
jgi:eukaryotic-like serine/threonine-protein kinase